MRVALNKLGPYLKLASDDAKVIFKFDGEVLKIEYSDGTLAMPATGKPWPSRFSIPAATLQHLPKRLMYAKIEVSIWKSSLSLADGVIRVSLQSRRGNHWGVELRRVI